MAAPQLAGIPVGYGLSSRTAPKSMRLGPLLFTGAATILIDLSIVQEQDRLPNVQAIYLDNTQNTHLITIVCTQTGQTLYFAPSAAFYTPILLPVEGQFSVSSAGAGTTDLFALNFPVGFARFNLT